MRSLLRSRRCGHWKRRRVSPLVAVLRRLGSFAPIRRRTLPRRLVPIAPIRRRTLPRWLGPIAPIRRRTLPRRLAPIRRRTLPRRLVRIGAGSTLRGCPRRSCSCGRWPRSAQCGPPSRRWRCGASPPWIAPANSTRRPVRSGHPGTVTWSRCWPSCGARHYRPHGSCAASPVRSRRGTACTASSCRRSSRNSPPRFSARKVTTPLHATTTARSTRPAPRTQRCRHGCRWSRRL